MPSSPSRVTDIFTYSLSLSISLKTQDTFKTNFPQTGKSSTQASAAQLAGKEKPTTGCSPGFLFKTLYGRFLNLSATPSAHRSCRERRTSLSRLCVPGRRRRARQRRGELCPRCPGGSARAAPAGPGPSWEL